MFLKAYAPFDVCLPFFFSPVTSLYPCYTVSSPPAFSLDGYLSGGPGTPWDFPFSSSGQSIKLSIPPIGSQPFSHPPWILRMQSLIHVARATFSVIERNQSYLPSMLVQINHDRHIIIIVIILAYLILPLSLLSLRILLGPQIPSLSE